MIRAELLGQHTHHTVCGTQVHIYQRHSKFIARGRFGGQVFGETLGGEPLQASSRLRRLLTEIEEGTFLRPSEVRRRPLRRGGPIPRLDLHQLCDDHLAETRRLRGKKTAATYLSRLRPVLSFANTPGARRRWPLARDIDREFAAALRAALFETPVTRNGRAGGRARPMSARQVHNVLTTLRTVLSWALRLEVRKLPADFVKPLTPDIIGHRPIKDPVRAVKLPLDLRVRLVEGMDAWQLCHLAPSLVLPMRPEEAAGLLIADVELDRRRLRFGTRFGDRDFTKGRRSFEVPFPPELEPIFQACIGARAAGPLLRRRPCFEGRERPMVHLVAPGDVEAAYEAALLGAGRGTVQSEQDAKAVLRRLLRQAGGISTDNLAREFGKVLRCVKADPGVRFSDTRSAVTTDMNRAGVPELELRYLTGHTTSDILNEYVTLDPDGVMAAYFRSIRRLLEAIAQRALLVLVEAEATTS
jgi:integrase